VACVKQCAEAAPLTPDALRTAPTRLLFCAQWPAGDEDVLQLLPHEAATLTWCTTPAVWVKNNRVLSGLPSKRPPNGSHDSICIHLTWKPICAGAAKWCAYVFDVLVEALHTQHAEGTDRHDDVARIK